MRIAYLTLIAFAVVACESKDAKYKRLTQELAVAQKAVDNEHLAATQNMPVCPDLSNLPTTAYTDACNKRIADEAARLALAQREMNAFMSGR